MLCYAVLCYAMVDMIHSEAGFACDNACMFQCATHGLGVAEIAILGLPYEAADCSFLTKAVCAPEHCGP